MRLLYDVTFNGAPKPLPSGYNSSAGPSGFFSPSTNREKSKRLRNAFPSERKREFHGREAIHLTRASFHGIADSGKARGERSDLNTVIYHNCVRQIIERNNYIGYMKSSSRNSSQKKLSEMDDR